MSSPFRFVAAPAASRVPRRRAVALSAVSALGLLTLLTVGCQPSGSGGEASTTGDTKAAATTGGGDGKKLRLAFVTNNTADFWTIAQRGTEKAATELPDVTVEFQKPADGSAAEQKRIVDDLMSKGVDGIAISPVDPANQTRMLSDVAKKALLVTQDSDAPDSDRACYIGTDNVAAGRQAGELLKEALPEGGEVMLFVGKRDAQNAKERIRGIEEAIKGSKITVLDIRTDDADQVKAKANAADTLVKYPDLAGMVGLWGYNGPAILNAVKDAGKVGKVKIVCFDEQDETLAGVKDGSIHGTVVQQPFEFGYQSITAMAKYLGGDKGVFPGNKVRLVPTKTVKQTDVDAFSTELAELKGKS